MTNFIKFLLLLSFLIYIQACSSNETSKEDQVRLYINELKVSAEKRSHTEIGMKVDDNYSDYKQLNKSQLIGLAARYFFMHNNIHLFVKIEEMTFHSKNQVNVILYVAMAGNVISDASMLTSLRAKIYKFDLHLIKEDEWLLKLADWKRSNVKDMMQSMTTSIETIE